MEAPYYVVLNDPLCFDCGREEDLRDADGFYSICGLYCAEGRVAKQKNSRAFKTAEQTDE
mgnify:FL=1